MPVKAPCSPRATTPTFRAPRPVRPVLRADLGTAPGQDAPGAWQSRVRNRRRQRLLQLFRPERRSPRPRLLQLRSRQLAHRLVEQQRARFGRVGADPVAAPGPRRRRARAAWPPSGTIRCSRRDRTARFRSCATPGACCASSAPTSSSRATITSTSGSPARTRTAAPHRTACAGSSSEPAAPS